MIQQSLVAVYGSLRKGMSNHRLLMDSPMLSTERIGGFKMYSLGGFPFIASSDNEDDRITIEVYGVDQETMRDLDILEGYNPRHPESSFYNRKLVQTSLGDAWIYFIDGRENNHPVLHGDWVQYRKDLYRGS